MQVADKNQMDQAIDEIGAVLRERHHIIYDDDFRIQNRAQTRSRAS